MSPAANDFVPLLPSTVRAQYEFVTTAPGVALRCVSIESRARNRLVFFLPGWFSLPRSWRTFLAPLVRAGDIVYVETREKTSARLDPGTSLAPAEYVQDLLFVVRQKQRPDRPYVLLGSSLGAAVIIDALPLLDPPPRAIVLVSPNFEFPIPAVTKLLDFLPAFVLPGVKRFARPFLVRARVDRSDAGHAERFVEALGQADPARLRTSCLELRKYVASLSRLKEFRGPALVLGGTRDAHHDRGQIDSIVGELRHVEYHDLRTFSACHSSAAAQLITAFLDRVVPEEGVQAEAAI